MFVLLVVKFFTQLNGDPKLSFYQLDFDYLARIFYY